MSGRRLEISCSLLVPLLAAAGIWLNYREPNASKNLLLFFTTQSNLWIGAACLAAAGFALAGRDAPGWFWAVKYMLTVSIAVTGLVYNLVLAPQYGRYFGSLLRAYSPSVALLHLAVPALGLLSYLAFDPAEPDGRRAWLGPVPLLAYLAFILTFSTVSADGYLFDGLGGPSRFPYFFLDYIRNGWFTLAADPARLGVFWWVAPALLLTYALSRFLLFLHRKLAGRKSSKTV